jgi:hypothetical protein
MKLEDALRNVRQRPTSNLGMVPLDDDDDEDHEDIMGDFK